MPEKILRKLPDPQPMPMTVTDALRSRRTIRTISDRPLSDAELANLLWAAAGATTKDGKRTAPSCLNLRSVSVFLLAKDGVWKTQPLPLPPWGSQASREAPSTVRSSGNA